MEKNYYQRHATRYIKETLKCDMSFPYYYFLKRMKRKGSILDIGFGSGRDMEYFHSKGYQVEGLDPTERFCERMKEKGYTIYQNKVEEMDFDKKYDAIWACASLHHVKSENLSDVFVRCAKAIKKGGFIYASFRCGDFEGEKEGRYYNYVTKKKLQKYLESTNLIILSLIVYKDLKRDDISWLNCILADKEMNRMLIANRNRNVK